MSGGLKFRFLLFDAHVPIVAFKQKMRIKMEQLPLEVQIFINGKILFILFYREHVHCSIQIASHLSGLYTVAQNKPDTIKSGIIS